MWQIPFWSWDAQINNGHPGDERKSYCFYKSEYLGGPFLLFERGQEKMCVCVCVSLECKQTALLIYQKAHDVLYAWRCI